MISPVQPKDIDKKKKKKVLQLQQQRAMMRKEGERRRAMESDGFGYIDIIEAAQGLTYRPRTTETKEVYELMLSIVRMALDD